MIRSENQVQVDGYSKMQVFVASPSVTVSNVQTHSSRSYVAEPINEFQPYCAPKAPVARDCPKLPRRSINANPSCRCRDQTRTACTRSSTCRTT